MDLPNGVIVPAEWVKDKGLLAILIRHDKFGLRVYVREEVGKPAYPLQQWIDEEYACPTHVQDARAISTTKALENAPNADLKVLTATKPK